MNYPNFCHFERAQRLRNLALSVKDFSLALEMIICANFVFNSKEEHIVGAGDAAIVPAGTLHNVINTSATKPLKLYTIYAPPNHRDGVVYPTRADAESGNESFDGKTTK